MKQKDLKIYRKMAFIFPVFFICMLAFSFTIVSAQSENPTDDEVNAIARELYCPVCENVPLDVCPTQACAQWRGLIKEKLVQGWNKDQIKQYFVDQYGDRVLAQPPARGLNWLVYILPPLFFLIGVYLVYLNLKNIKKPAKNVNPVVTQQDEKYLNEIEKALNALKKNDE